MNDFDDHQQQCCWCGTGVVVGANSGDNTSGPNFGNHRNKIALLLELMGFSPSLSQENDDQRLCEDCIKLTSRGTQLKIQLELGGSVSAASQDVRLLHIIKSKLQSRTQNLNNGPQDSNAKVQISRNQSAIQVEKAKEGTKLKEVIISDTGSDVDEETNREQEMNPGGKSSGTSAIETGLRYVTNYKIKSLEFLKGVTFQEGDEFECYGCNETFKNFGEKLVHEDTHKVSHPGGKLHVHKCGICEKQVHGFSNFKRHRKSHPVKNPFSCDVCGKICSSQDVLLQHSGVHDSFLQFKCDHCSKKFGTERGLEDHRRIHTGEKPYKCDICNAAFGRMHSMTRHRRETHTADKTIKPYRHRFYGCVNCNEKFTGKDELDNHHMSHTGKPFKCKGCRRGFISESRFAAHKANKHLHQKSVNSSTLE